MKILVLSDSHSGFSFMRCCVDAVRPDVIIHLGDHYDDAQTLREEYPSVAFYCVPGNCDKYRCDPGVPAILIPRIGGCPVYLTHGHLHRVKQTLTFLLRDARASKVQAVLYGHTHVADCHQESDGLWVLNPGSCGYYGGSAGLIEIHDKRITSCRILRQEDLEGIV